MGWTPNIFVRVDMDRRQIFTGTCLQCKTALCLEVCPTDAIKRDPDTAAVIVNKDLCIACGMCVEACPFGYMNLDAFLQKATKCDLCGGNPKCVQVCMARALHFGSIESLTETSQTRLRLGLRAVPANKDEER